MAFSHDEERVRAERARAVGLFRYGVIREAADPALSTKQRGRLVRALAARDLDHPTIGRVLKIINKWFSA